MIVCARVIWVEQASRLLNWASRPIPSVARESSNAFEQPKLMAGAEIESAVAISFRDIIHASTDFGGTPKSTGETPVPPEIT